LCDILIDGAGDFYMGIEDFIRKVAVQTAVYWGAPVANGYGAMTYSEPVEIKCRWEDTVELVRAADGEEYSCRAQLLVTQDLSINGYIYLGELSDLDSDQADSPQNVIGTYKIRRLDKTPLFMSTNKFVRKVYI